MTAIFRVCLGAFALLSSSLLAEEAPAPAAAPAAPSAEAKPARAPDAESNDEAEEGGGKKVPPFERYKTIVDRKPFGREPPNFNPDAPSGSAAAAAAAAEEPALSASEEEQKIISSVRVSVLNVTPGRKAAVGFTDSSKSPAVNYYLLEGESRDGWTVKSVNVSEKSVVLSQNGVDATIPLGGGSGSPDAGRKGGRPQGAMRAAFAPQGNRPAGAENPGNEPGGAFAHLRARRLRKEADQKAEAEAAAAAAAQAKAEREQAAADREQQRAALLQIQEELRRQREERQNNQGAAQDQE